MRASIRKRIKQLIEERQQQPLDDWRKERNVRFRGRGPLPGPNARVRTRRAA